MRFAAIIILMAALFTGLPSAATASAPTNDNFAAAQPVVGEFGEVAATSKEATKEASEPAHAGNAGGASVWFTWTADRNGTLTVWTYQVTFDTVLAVYTGTTVDTLAEIGSNDDYGASTASRVTVPGVAGTTYRIAVDGVGGANGPFGLRWRQGPENDNFADALLLPDPAGSVEGLSFGATAEPGEVTELSTASSWYRWTALETGTFGFHVRNAAGLTVFTGSTIGGLTPLGAAAEELLFPAVASTTYSIRVAGYNWSQTYPFRLFWGKAPANDAFADAFAITGGNGKSTGSTAFASVETGEPVRGNGSVWYTWTAPVTGHVRFDAWGVEGTSWDWIDTILTVYKGANLDTLKVVTRNDDWYWTELPGFGSAVSFRATAGTTYAIAVGSWGSYSWGPVALRWYPGAIVFGKSGDNQITGTPGRDYLNGMDGNDVVHGLAGNDVVVGGDGRDRLFGDSGADALDSRDDKRGNDVIYGGPGKDSVRRDRGDEVHEVP